MKSREKMDRARQKLALYFEIVSVPFPDRLAARCGASIARGESSPERFEALVNDPAYRRTVRRMARGKDPTREQFRRAAEAIYRAGKAQADQMRGPSVRAEAP